MLDGLQLFCHQEDSPPNIKDVSPTNNEVILALLQICFPMKHSSIHMDTLTIDHVATCNASFYLTHSLMGAKCIFNVKLVSQDLNE